MDSLIIEDLEQEIRYLRNLLEVNGIPYDYQAYKKSQVAADKCEIEFPELTRENAIDFYGMFRGRKDVFAQRSAKKGYFTQCDNFWKYGICSKRNGDKVRCRDCQNQSYTKLTYFPMQALTTARRRPRRGQKMGERTALVPDGVAEVLGNLSVGVQD